MRKLSSLERIALGVAIGMVMFGGWMVLFPKESVGIIPASERYRDRSYIQTTSKEASRVHGVIIIVSGLTFGALAIYPLKR